ncbi:MAG: 16S rRNA (uracil(1498)-N(3))-methyltransferase [Prochlorococcus sp.]|nr:16S rRNA (uracil(1498)-N(3))-methyltransferase [Prochlorococcus sp.]CAI8158135.1 MAG: Ribosomal RNA small subunit methyltransferase E [Prochlorococcus marinus str. MIT 9215]
MAELRRLLVEPQRLTDPGSADGILQLSREESHYLRRVLRLRNGQSVAVVDGIGHLWEADVQVGDLLKLSTPASQPAQQQSRFSLQLGLAVVVPRRGFDELTRMSCELGIDLLQPLRSQRKTPQADERPSRWQVIIRESVEQSERLWQPDLLDTVEASVFWQQSPKRSALAIASTRRPSIPDLQNFVEGLDQSFDQLWVAIGPEGGWTADEEQSAEAAGWVPVSLGDSILRTSTAAVAAAQTMVSWRRLRSQA